MRKEWFIILKKTALLLCLSVILSLALGFASDEASAYTGVATYYDLTGNWTSSGDLLEYDDFTCAAPLDYYGYPVYPYGTTLGITYNGIYAECVVTDTGTFGYWGRDLDLNIGIANYLGLAPVVGVDYVDIQVVAYDPTWEYGRQY